jgi:hypothetical protein
MGRVIRNQRYVVLVLFSQLVIPYPGRLHSELLPLHPQRWFLFQKLTSLINQEGKRFHIHSPYSSEQESSRLPPARL